MNASLVRQCIEKLTKEQRQLRKQVEKMQRENTLLTNRIDQLLPGSLSRGFMPRTEIALVTVGAVKAGSEHWGTVDETLEGGDTPDAEATKVIVYPIQSGISLTNADYAVACFTGTEYVASTTRHHRRFAAFVAIGGEVFPAVITAERDPSGEQYGFAGEFNGITGVATCVSYQAYGAMADPNDRTAFPVGAKVLAWRDSSGNYWFSGSEDFE